MKPRRAHNRGFATRKTLWHPGYLGVAICDFMTFDGCIFKFLRCSVDGKQLIRLQCEDAVLNSSGLALVGTGPQVLEGYLLNKLATVSS